MDAWKEKMAALKQARVERTGGRTAAATLPKLRTTSSELREDSSSTCSNCKCDVKGKFCEKCGSPVSPGSAPEKSPSQTDLSTSSSSLSQSQDNESSCEGKITLKIMVAGKGSKRVNVAPEATIEQV